MLSFVSFVYEYYRNLPQRMNYKPHLGSLDRWGSAAFRVFLWLCGFATS
jgi:hypothetical protein